MAVTNRICTAGQSGKDHRNQEPARDEQRARLREHLTEEALPQVARGTRARDDDTGRQRDEQRGNLADQPVADGQYREDARSLVQVAELDVADYQPADDIDDGDDDARDGVAADEFAGAVHRAVEIGLANQVFTALAGLGLGYQPGVKVGVDAELLAGHSVQRKARRDFADARGALGYDDELNNDQNDEDDEPDHKAVAADERTEGVEHLAREERRLLRRGVAQYQARRGDVERQAIERRHQQHRR